MGKKDYPKALKYPESWKCGNHMVHDDYLYMTDASNPKVSSWVAEENTYTDEWFQDKKVNERIQFLKNKKRKPIYSGITSQDNLLYATKNGTDGSYAAVMLNKDFEEQKILLSREMMDDRMQIFGVCPCPANSEMIAYSALKDGAARMSVIVRNMKENTTLAELDNTFFFTWSSDGKYIYYSVASQREDGTTENSVVRWSKNTGAEKIYTWPGHAVFLKVTAAPREGIFVHVCKNYHDTEVLFFNPEYEYIHIQSDGKSKMDYIGTIEEQHFFLTDEEAPMGKIICMKLGNGGEAERRTIIEEGNFPLEGGCAAGGKLLLLFQEHASSRLRQYNKEGQLIKELELPDEIGNLTMPQITSSGQKVFYWGFESFRCPQSILKYDIETETMDLIYSVEPKEEKDMVVERRFVTSVDGQRVLAFLVHKRGMELNGRNPTLMYGYGGYGASQLPWYSNPFVGLDIPDWLERGGLYVHCILRGGEEYGAKWHEAGCGLHKKNVFHDFICIAKALIDEGWTTPEHIAICGGSNGGLLTTALLTMEPELWKCVIASVPHTDMLHFSQDDRGAMYVTEYGDPRTEEFYEYMRSYSPYHNIKQGIKYPYVYVQTGECDNNVPPYHGKKFAAALQQATTGEAVLLRVLEKGSHDRGTGEVFYRTAAEMQRFIEYALGM